MRNIRFIYGLCIIPAMMLLLNLTPAATAATPKADGSSLLSQGRWIKVHVDTTSVCRITRRQLLEWGFSNPDKVIVAGYGSVERAHTLDTAPDDLPVLPVHRASDAIYFYAEGDTRVTLNTVPTSGLAAPFTEHYNYYSSGSYYFIGERDGMSSPELTGYEATGEPAEYADSCYVMTHTRYREYHPYTHGMMPHSRAITASAPRSIDFDINGQGGSASLYYSYVWHHGNTGFQSIGLDFPSGITSSSISDDRLTRNSTNEHTEFSVKKNARTLLKTAAGADRFTARFTNPGGRFDNLALISTTLIYRRANRMYGPCMHMLIPGMGNGGAIRLEGAPSGLAVWDVTNPRRPVALTVSPSGGTGVAARAIPSSGIAKVCAFIPSASVPSPEYAGTVANQDLHSLDGADMLIVTTEATYAAALRLAEAHERWQGLNVAVLRQSEVFNEYSSGALHPNGLRHLVKRLATSGQRPLRYLLLFGRGSRDSRADFDKSGEEYMVMYNTEDPSEMGNNTKQYSSDLYFGTLADKISPSLASMRYSVTVSVGRAPAPDAAAAEAFADKCIAYLSDPSKAGSYNHTMISGGIGNANAHLEMSESIGRAITSLLGNPTVCRSHLSLFPLSNKQTIHSDNLDMYYDARFAGDMRLFTYTGHSSLNAISHSSHTVSRELNMAYGSLPVVYMSSCNTTPLDIHSPSLGVTMALHNPGPIAVIGSGNEVYLTYNNRLYTSFVEHFYSADGGECLGDVFRTAVNSVRNSYDQYANNLCYNYLGDPALPRYMPERSVKVTEIGGDSGLTSDSHVTVSAQTKIKIAGVITGGDGNTDTSFNGRLMLDIYDAPHSQKTYKYDNTDTITSITIDEDVLHSSAVDVKAGRWSTEVTLPEPPHKGASRMTLNALSDSRVIASGSNRMLTVTADAPSGTSAGADTEAPEIRLWLDSPDMTDGAEVSATPTLYMEITDRGSGVNLNTSAIGMAPKVMIDGTAISAAPHSLRPEGEGRVCGEYRFGELADGHHSITVTARDLAGNSASQTLDFIVVHRDVTASLTVSESIARDGVTFALSHSLPTDVRKLRLVIRDMDGRTVLSTDTPAFPFVWDFRDSSGTEVPDGTYRVSVSIDARPYYTTTPETKFSVIKR